MCVGFSCAHTEASAMAHTYIHLPLCLMCSRRLNKRDVLDMALINHYDGNEKFIAFTICQLCEKALAEIFQVDGDYCINCWQEITHTNV